MRQSIPRQRRIANAPGVPNAPRELRRAPVAAEKLLAVWMGVSCATVYTGLKMPLGPILVRPLELMLGLALIGVLLRGGLPKFARASVYMGALLAVYMLVYFLRSISGFMTNNPADGVVELVQAIELASLGTLIAMATSDRLSRWLFFRSFFICLLPIALYTVSISVMAGQFAGFKKLNEPKYSFGFMAVLLVSGLFTGIKQPWISSKLLLFPILILLVLSGERSAWLGLIAVMIFFSVSLDRTVRKNIFRRIILPTFLVVTILAVVVVVASKENNYIGLQVDRLVEPVRLVNFDTGEINYVKSESPSNRSRLMQLNNVIKIMKESPWFGVGTGGYMWYAYNNVPVQHLRYYNGIHGELWYLLGENGVVVASVYILVWIGFFVVTVRLNRTFPPEARPSIKMIHALGLYGLVLATLIGGGVVNLMLLMVPLGLLAGVRMEYAKMGPRRPLTGR